jgi:glutamate-1-semialdehyde 2,1-aminomutase
MQLTDDNLTLIEPANEDVGKVSKRSENKLSIDESDKLYCRAQHVLPGGTTRVTVKRTPIPIYMERGEGAYMFDVDGNKYLDFVSNYTVLIHGHAFPPVSDAIKAQLEHGSCYANPTVTEIELAELMVERVPAVEKIRFTNSGTEAVMFAIKAARAFTGRSKIAKLEGAYHGAYDWAEVSEASTPNNWGGHRPASTPFYQGVPDSVLDETVVLPFNDIDTSLELILENADELACILIDVMPSRAGLISLDPEYLKMLNDVARANNIVLISDEVLNFRLGYEGISAAFSFRPDLITFGKIIGGGLPIGAVGGSLQVMSVFDSSKGRPLVPHGGTFAANPLSMVAGLASMKHLTRESFEHLTALGDRIRSGIQDIALRLNLTLCTSGEGSMFRYHLLPSPPKTSREAFAPPLAENLHKEISQRMLIYGIVLPSDTSGCCSTAMTFNNIENLLERFEQVLREIPDFSNRLSASLAERMNIQR